jgi:hypothetical protein
MSLMSAEKFNKGRNDLLLSFGSCQSIADLAKKYQISKQAMHQRLKNFCLLKLWKEHALKMRDPSCPAVYSVYFSQEPEKRYFGSTQNFKRRKLEHLSALKHNHHSNKNLQEHFNKWGVESIHFEILKKVSVENLLFAEKFFVEKNGLCFNIRSPLRLTEELKEYIKAKNNRPKKKSKYRYLVWSRPAQLWKAQPSITVSGKQKQVYLGYFKDEEEAHRIVEDFLRRVLNAGTPGRARG